MRLSPSQLAAMPERVRSQIAAVIGSQMAGKPSASTKPVETFSNEAALHRAIWSALQPLLPCDAVAWHSANGERRDRATGAKLAAMGVVPGVADLILMRAGRALAVEIKSPKGKLSGEQKTWQARWVRAGGEYVVAQSVEEALASVARWLDLS